MSDLSKQNPTVRGWSIMDEIKIEDVRRLEDEIARLNQVIQDLSDHNCAAERMQLIKQQGAEIDQLKEEVESWKGAHSVASADRDLSQVVARAKYQSLITRAADAIWELSADEYPQQWMVDLLKELRKAAE